MLHRDVAGTGFEIVKSEVPLAKRAAAGILATEAHGRAFENQAAERQGFAEGPV